MKNNRFRCHPSIIIENLGTLIVGVIAVLIFNMDDFLEILKEAGEAVDLKDTIISISIVTALVAVFTGYQVIIYLKTWISVDNDTLLVERLTLLRTVRRSFNTKNISNINLEQNLFERLIGTCKVKIDTNSQSTANETDIKIVLKLTDAKAFRSYILEHIDGEGDNIQRQLEMDSAGFDIQYTPEQVALHCFYSVSLFVVNMTIVIVAGMIIGFTYFAQEGFTVANVASALGGIISVVWIAFTCIYSLIKDFFKYYGFRAKRVENRIIMSYGLIKRRQYVLPVDKINTIKVKARLISRLFGRQSVEVICIGVGDEKNENSLLLLSEKKEVISKRLALLLPEFSIEEPEMEMRKPCSIWAHTMGFIGVMAAECGIIVPFTVFRDEITVMQTLISAAVFGTAAVLIAVYVMYVILSLRTEGMHIGENTLVVVTGAFTRTVTWIPYRRIQSLEFSQGPAARRYGYASGVVSILAATAGSAHVIPPLGEELFRDIQKKIIEI